jgi:hypothetical protein
MCDVAIPEHPQTSRQATALLAHDGGLRNRRDSLSRRPGPVRDGARDPGSILTYRQSSAETPSLAALLGRLKGTPRPMRSRSKGIGSADISASMNSANHAM